MITKIKGKEHVRCELCEEVATYDNAAKLGWDWFTGFLKNTHHYCARCKTKPERRVAFEKSMTPPLTAPNQSPRSNRNNRRVMWLGC